MDRSETSRWAALTHDFDAGTLDRGAAYAREHRVLSVQRDPQSGALRGKVVGRGGLYEVEVGFDDRGITEGRCSCPVGYDCKHVVAVLLSDGQPGAHTPGHHQRTGGPAAPPAPAWEERLGELIRSQRPPRTGMPLAIELKLSPAHSPTQPPRLLARLMRPGARSRWVNGSLDWRRLDAWSTREKELHADHLELLRAIRLTHSVRQERTWGYGGGFSGERTIDLTKCDGPELWGLLRRAREAGIALLDAGHDELPPIGEADFVFDVSRVGDTDHDATDAAYTVQPKLGLTGAGPEPIVPLAMIGDPAHGVVCTPEADRDAHADVNRRRVRLLRLSRPITQELQRMLIARERITVPAADRDRLSALSPALARLAPIVSHDGSFTAPTVAAPELVLHVQHVTGGRLTLDWEWEYRIGERTLRPRLGQPSTEAVDAVRDPAAEQAALHAVTINEPQLANAGLLDRAGHPAPSLPVTFVARQAMDVHTELLPRLAARPDLRLRVEGLPPDYRDVGDTLQIEVSTSETGDRDWFDLGVSITVEGHEVPFEEVFRALARGETRMLMADGAHFALTDPRLDQLRALIQEARELVDAPAGTARISRFQAGLWDELAALATDTDQAERWRTAVAPLHALTTIPATELPRELTATLRPYQQEGFQWLATLHDLGLGGILADDMGLGKTVQTLALLTHVRAQDPATGPFLVIAPTSVAPNWRSEAERFAPHLRCAVHLDTLARSGRDLARTAAEHDLVITTYTLLRLDAEAYAAQPWAGVLLGEAQFVKNPRAKTHRAVRDLKAPFTLAITGTPLENHLGELWALLALTAPGLFPDPQRFANHYVKPIERDHDAERLARLRRRIRPLMMRRTKELVAADLPAKQEQTLTIDLHPRHRRLYDTHLQRERQRVLAMLDDYEANRIAIFRSLTRMRQLSLHPGLVDPAHAAVPCAKLDALLEHLTELTGAGHRALVFSQFTSFLTLAAERLTDAGVGHAYLDGATRRREQVIERFRAGTDPVFLISLKAGGVGLNLTEADYCFLLDPWWNPAAEAQAIGRAHRIGQRRQVLAYRLIARNTIEEKVRALAEAKAALFTGVMDDGELFSGAVSAADIRGLME